MVGLSICQINHLSENAGGNIKVNSFKMGTNVLVILGIVDNNLSVFALLLFDLNTVISVVVFMFLYSTLIMVVVICSN
eukprot:5581143-Heterocapsa_arctica.AAC.1